MLHNLIRSEAFGARWVLFVLAMIAVPLRAVGAEVSVSPVFAILPGAGMDGGESTLIRNPSGIAFSMSAPTIPDGHAVTIWVVVFNNPAGCLSELGCGVNFGDFEPGNAALSDTIGPVAGKPVNKGENAHFAGHLAEGDTSLSINPVFFGQIAIGMIDSKKAEVHLIARSHGPSVPGLIDEQIHSYDGGCEVLNIDPFGDVPDAVGECSDFLFSAHIAPE